MVRADAGLHPDRTRRHIRGVREILTALLDPDFSAFPRKRAIDIAAAAGMTEYSEQLNALMQVRRKISA